MKKITNLILLILPLSVQADYIAKVPLSLPIKFSNVSSGNTELNPTYPEGEEKGSANFKYKLSKTTYYSLTNVENGDYEAEPIDIFITSNDKECYSVELANGNGLQLLTDSCNITYPNSAELIDRSFNVAHSEGTQGQVYTFPLVISAYNGSFANKTDVETFNENLIIRKENFPAFTNISFNQSFTIGQVNYGGLDFYGVGVSSIVNEQNDFYSFGASSPYSFTNGGHKFYFEEFSIADNGDGSCVTTVSFRTDVRRAYYYAERWLTAVNNREIEPWGFIVSVNGEQLAAGNYNVYGHPDDYAKIVVELGDINDGASGTCNNNVLSALRDNVGQNINISISSFVQ